MFGKGISATGDILDLAAGVDIVNKSGAWYQYEGEKIGQGRENAKLYLENNPQIRDDIEAKVRAHYGLPVDNFSSSAASAATTDDGDDEAKVAKKSKASK